MALQSGFQAVFNPTASSDDDVGFSPSPQGREDHPENVVVLAGDGLLFPEGQIIKSALFIHSQFAVYLAHKSGSHILRRQHEPEFRDFPHG